MNKFDKTRNGYQQYDMVSLFQSAQERTMRHLNVSSLAKVKAVNGTNITAMLFPKRKGTETIEINAYNLFNSAINVGDIILVVFTDRDFNGNLATIRQGNDYVAETGDDDLHSLNNAVAIEITPFSESELKLKTIDYQSIKGEGNIDLSLTYALKSNLENNYYTKSEINERLADDFYTKGEIDSKLNGKQNKATPLGNNITPVYIDSNGDFALCASYTNASVKHASSADSATGADKAMQLVDSSNHAWSVNASWQHASYIPSDTSYYIAIMESTGNNTALIYTALASNVRVGHSTNSDYANNFSNFGTRNNNTGWGTLTASNGYTIRYGVDLPSGGGLVIAEKNSQTSVQIDGDIYVDEGHSKVATESQVNATKAELESKISSLENEIAELKNIISGLVSYN